MTTAGAIVLSEKAPRRSRRRDTALAALLYALLAVLAFGRSFVGDRIFVPMHTDRFEPWRSGTSKERQEEIAKDEYTAASDKLISFRADDAITMAAMREGRLALWNPTNACGVPYLAQGLYGFFYPPHWIWRWMSPERSYGILAAFHHFLAAFFTFLFVRRIGARFHGAWFAGLAFAGSTCLLARAHYYQYIESVCWVPLGLLCVESWLRDKSLAALSGLALTMALILLVGWPQMAAFAGFLFFLSALVRSIAVELKTPPLKILGAALVVLALFLAVRNSVPDVLWLYAAYPATTLAIVIVAGKDRKSFFATLGGVAIALGIGALIAAVQYLPAAEWMRSDGSRSASAPELLAANGMRPGFLLELVAPGIFGRPWDAQMETVANFLRYYALSVEDLVATGGAAQGYGNPVENASYLGLLAILLLPLGLLVRSPRRIFLALALLWYLGFALGAKALVYPAYFAGFFVGTDPRRALVFAAFAASCLAGLGLSHSVSNRRRPLVPIALLLFVVFAFGSRVYGFGDSGLFTRLCDHIHAIAAAFKIDYDTATEGVARGYFTNLAETRWYRLLGIGIASGIALVALMAGKRRSARKGAALACLVLTIDCGVNALPFLATQPADRYLASHPLIDHLRNTIGTQSRLARFGAAEMLPPTEVVLSPNLAGCFGLRDAWCYTVSPPRRIERLADALRYGAPLPAIDKDHPSLVGSVFLKLLTRAPQLASRTLDLFAVASILGRGEPPQDLPAGVTLDATFGDCYVLKNANALPRVFVVGAAETMKDAEPDAVASRVLDPAFDPHGTVLLEEDLAPPPAGSGALPTARLVRDDFEQLEIELAGGGSRGGYLVVLDTYAPGWEATVDGAPSRVVRGDYAFRAMSIPPGARRVVMNYAPKSVKIGKIVSCGGMALALLLCLVGLVRGSRPRVARIQNRVIVADT